jgi:hypothetical protein
MHLGTILPVAGLALALAVPLFGPSLLPRDGDPTLRAPLVGLWASAWGGAEGDPLRFYYFHDAARAGSDEAVGLYRYGRVGLNQTNSFSWSVDGDRVHFTFRKTGEKRTARFRITNENGTRTLFLDGDPKDEAGTRYVYVPPPPLVATGTEAIDDPSPDDVSSTEGDHPFARMWTNARPYATGGMGFAIYQFRPPALDGRGVGWFHAGDFDDWTTETLVYRRAQSSLELTFPLRQEHGRSEISEGVVDGVRLIDLRVDPRNYWHRRVYIDGGRAFTTSAIVLPGGDTPFSAVELVDR